MKRATGFLMVVGAGVLLAAQAAQAQLDMNKFYVGAGVGGSIMQDLTLKNFGGAKNKVDTGFRGTVSAGYNLTEHFAVELETGGAGYNLNTDGGQPLRTIAEHAYLVQTPFLGDVILKMPLKCGATPYIGAGAGGVASTLYLRGPGLRDRDTDFTFAYQGIAGLKYALDKNMEVGVCYRVLGVQDQTWFGDDPILAVRSENTLSHSIMATFTWNF